MDIDAEELSELYTALDDVDDPYPMWADGRHTEPVQHTAGAARQDMYVVHSWDDVQGVLRDGERFSSRINDDTMGPYMGKTILAMDGDEHRAYRNLVASAFRASALERWGGEVIEPSVNSLLDQIAPRGKADLVHDLTARFPVQVIAAITGVPLEDYDQFQIWADEINLGPRDPKRSKAASQAMTTYLEPIVADRRRNPQGDLLSELVTAEVEGHTLDDDHLYGFLRLLIPAGAETTFRMFGNALVGLLTHPDVLAEVTADRTLIPAVIEETLRWETSVTMVNRETTRDVDVGGCPIPKGAGILALVGSANRDENHYDRPDEWDPHREPKPHMAFGTGIHQCLGMHLARLELRIGLDGVLTRLPNLRPDPAFAPPEIRGLPFRSPPALHVLFDAA
ncbi:MAG TPA: cytochrome P450 [Acidimicrobiales bacterium]|jgi:cytochrome P450|nr:cytochrome P450 [Acidimicrobiales bacterium]